MSRVEVWWTDLGDGDPAVLSDDERERAARMRAEADRRRFVAARSWLRSMLGSVTGLSAAEHRFSYGPLGRPVLKGSTGVEFNLAHSGDLAVLAIGRRGPIGVDVERAVPGGYDRAAAALVLSECELGIIDESPDPERAFVDIWTRKEALAKADGQGLRRELAAVTVGADGDRQVDEVRIRSLQLGLPGVSCAIATAPGVVVEIRGRA